MASIRQMPCGSWQTVVRRKGYPPQFRTFETQQDAKQWARQIEHEIDRNVFVDRNETDRQTVGSLIDRYLLEVTPLKKSARREKQRLQHNRLQIFLMQPASTTRYSPQ